MNDREEADARTVAARLAEIADLVERGALREARRRTARILADTDEPTQLLLAQCLQALERHPSVRVSQLRHLWRISDDDGRAIVEACAPRHDQLPTRPNHRDDAELRDKVRQAPRDLPTRWTTPTARRNRRPGDADTAAGRYFADRVEPEQDRDDRDDPMPLDYDRSALPPLRGLPCVVCRTERSSRDQHRRTDDGLCEDCRDSGRPGISPPPAPATRESWVIARCRYVADTSATPAECRARLRADWRHLARHDRATMTAWVAAQTT
ncbi:hypothetical protein GCM10010472_01220 [Pseudonocardia halophobica]|uniref:Uncharacterized protein n=1 Tax=Pseudonocardia halophobica TaxID=29401 RepID=A0A9W6L030_9PSEU|nr:hypothetical protein [Pseudonocardia halophobica]GLL10462.1 hypothetical protein GCM10017577_16020 [Pseudonocardia halophobica]